jgi:creatinine amidohydrolase
MTENRYMPEMTNLQVREYLERGGRTVLVPVGSTEDHGDHGPLWTDVYIPLEVCKRAAGELDALVGPPVPFGLAPDHRGASGVVSLRLETFLALLRDVCVSLAEAGFDRIALVNGHYVNTWAMQYAAAQFFDELPRGVRVLPFAYWQGLKPEEAEQYLSGSAGIHANVGETSAVLAIDPALCDMERVRDFSPEFGELHTNPFALLDPVFLATPGSFWALLEEGGGVWGSPSESTAERGEQFLQWGATAVVSLFRDMDAMHDRLAPHTDAHRKPRA